MSNRMATFNLMKFKNNYIVCLAWISDDLKKI
eukprot:SAG11_NODE_13344_length_659_cov_0.919643_1_plen_31_part_10